ncbi:hypothetical protein [Altererythrobacter lauratis]|uniref:DUF8021 domain-containing protein n=1 Tax=Alteraurantiacibacter lauratis TaxID=2054627 RepID=A0ABV7E9U4_9SPHN
MAFARMITAALGMAGAAFMAAPAAAQGACDRAQLQSLADAYVAAQQAGEGFRVPMGEWVQYRENYRLSSMTHGGVLATAHNVDWHRALLDTQTCNIFVTLIIANPESPWVLGTKISTRGGLVNRYDVVTTTTGDWLFDAAKTLEYARAEDWAEIPEGRRNTRAELIAAADAYLDLFNDPSVEVPWGTPCARLEGGLYTGRGLPTDSCNVGVPSGVELVERDYIVDEVLGAVAVRLRFGGAEGLADAHIFRVEDGRLRYIHTITNCNGVENCGFPPLSEMLANNPGMQPALAD